MEKILEESEVKIALNKATLDFLKKNKINEDWKPVIDERNSVLIFKRFVIKKKIKWFFW